jgi:hypothetical protein
MEPRVQSCPAPMFDQILCRFPSSQILVALADRFVLAAAVVTLGHQHGNLGAQFCQFEGTWHKLASVTLRWQYIPRTCDDCNCGARVDACQAEACNCRERRPCISSICDNKRRASRSLVNPIIERILGSLVYRERHGADEGYARKRRPDTYDAYISM